MDHYRVTIGTHGTMKGYRSMDTREFSYADLGPGHGIQMNRECDKAYEIELMRRIDVILDSFKSLYELEEHYNFLNPPNAEEKTIESLDERSIKDLNSMLEVVTFEDAQELKDTFSEIFSGRSHIRDYIVAAQILEAKGINIRNL